MNNLRIGAGELQVGQALPWPVYNAEGILLLKKGYVIRSNHQLDALLSRGLYRDVRDAQPESRAPREPRPQRSCPFDIINDLPARLRRALDDISAGRAQGLDSVRRITQDIQRVCREDADAALGSVHLWRQDSYPIAHLIHTAVLAELVGRRLGYDDERRRSLVAAALTSNLAMLELQEELSHQTGPLTEAQRAEIHAHPAEAHRLLRAAGLTDELWLDAVLQHHERPNGSGYASGLNDDAIREESKVIALADMYAAMVTPREYRPGLVARDALREIFLERGKGVDENLAVVFIKELGIYPPGSLVSLSNGEQAVVVRRSRDSKAPTVMSIVSPRGGPYAHPFKRRCDAGEHSVRDMLPHDPGLNLNLRLLWDYL